MSSYTMTVKEMLDMWVDEVSAKDRIELGRQKLFDFDYPVFDPTYKKEFETKFIRTFYMREIGFETEGLFKFNLETWMIVNMPYFNKLLESETLKYDVLTNAKTETTQDKSKNRNETQDRETNQTSNTSGSSDSTTNQTSTNDATNDQTSNGTQTTDDFNRHLESDTPDGRLNLTTNDGEGVIEYASKITEDSDNQNHTTTNETNGIAHSESVDNGTNNTVTSVDGTANQNDNATITANETEDFVESKVGKIGAVSYPKLVSEYREALLRIERKMFDEMQQLFMLVY